MEVCGTHTHAIRSKAAALAPAQSVELVSDRAPVMRDVPARHRTASCCLPASRALFLCSFGDMIRVPGLETSLVEERSQGADVRIVYSPLDALDLAVREPGREVVFAAVGFETTAPGVASVVLQARERGISNFSVYASHKLIVPAMKAVLECASRIEGFITPGHVSVIIGPEAYEEVARQYRAPCVATGFEPSDVLEGIAMLLECIAEKRIGSFVQYTRVVKPGGNKRAWDMLMRVFNVSGAEWRGLGEIPGSGWF